MEFLFGYLSFLAEVVTIVIAILIILSFAFSASQRQGDREPTGRLQVIHLNERLRELRHGLEGALLPAPAVKKQHKQEAKAQAEAEKAKAKAVAQEIKKGAKDKTTQDTESEVGKEKRFFVLNFNGDIRASALEHLRLEISALLTMAKPQDEVVVCVESPGGMVHNYGLAASQLSRVRRQGIPLTIVVDKVAASGGYLMAAVANKILAAPFALIGSIGVVAQIPNIHRLLKKNDVDVEILTAGKYKRTLTTMGENTDEGREKFIEELEDVHALFQEFVTENRPSLDIEAVATGEAWYGKRALELGLVDEICTSDEYLTSACSDAEVYELKWVETQKPIDRIMGKVNGLVDSAAAVVDGWRRV